MTAVGAVEPRGATTGALSRVEPVKPTTWRVLLVVVAVAAFGASFWRSGQQLPVLGVGVLAVLGLVLGVRSYRLEHPLLWHVGRTKPWALLGAGLAGGGGGNAGRGGTAPGAGSSGLPPV